MLTIWEYGCTVNHMKATIDIPDELMIRAKKRAVDMRRPFRELVIEGLRAWLDAPLHSGRCAPKRTIRWVCHEGGLPPELDLADRTRMTEWLYFHK